MAAGRRRQLDVANVNQFVVTEAPAKPKKAPAKKAEAPTVEPQPKVDASPSLSVAPATTSDKE